MKIDATPRAAIIRMEHCRRLMEARAAEINAHRKVDELKRAARAAGCDDVQIQAALRLVEGTA